MTNSTVWAARMQFHTSFNTNAMIPVLTSSMGSVKVLKHKPRNVLDLRHKGHTISMDDVVAGLHRYQLKRAMDPDRIRVTYQGRAWLQLEAAKMGMDPAPDARKLRVFGIKVTL